MDNKTTYRTTLNKAQWMIVEDKYHTALYVKPYGSNKDFYFSGNIFKSIADANAYLDKIDERICTPREEKPIEIPADYYGVRGRYYGD